MEATFDLSIDLWARVICLGNFTDRDAARAAATCTALRAAVRAIKPDLPRGPRSYLIGMGRFQVRYERMSRTLERTDYLYSFRASEIFSDAQEALCSGDLIDTVASWRRTDIMFLDLVHAAMESWGEPYDAARRAVCVSKWRRRPDAEEMQASRVMDAIIHVLFNNKNLPKGKRKIHPLVMMIFIFGCFYIMALADLVFATILLRR